MSYIKIERIEKSDHGFFSTTIVDVKEKNMSIKVEQNLAA